MVQGCGNDPYGFVGADLLSHPGARAGSMPAWAPLAFPGWMRTHGTIVSGRAGGRAPTYGVPPNRVGTQQCPGSMPGHC